VLRERGSPTKVDDRFDGGFGSDDPMLRRRGRTGDGRWEAGSITTAGGYQLDTVAVANPDGTSDVLVTECGD
jgi:hypothetical protein